MTGPVVLPRPGFASRVADAPAELLRMARAWAARKRPQTAPTPPPGPSYGLASSSIQIHPDADAFLERLVAALVEAAGDGSPVPVVVTSGIRSPAQQAAALAVKLRRGDDLFALYKRHDLVAEIVEAAGDTSDPDVDAMTRAVEAQVARSQFLSVHLSGAAVDLRTRDLSREQRDQLVAAVRQLGAKPVVESDHLHVERIPAR